MFTKALALHKLQAWKEALEVARQAAEVQTVSEGRATLHMLQAECLYQAPFPIPILIAISIPNPCAY